jgi:hypothetical protein
MNGSEKNGKINSFQQILCGRYAPRRPYPAMLTHLAAAGLPVQMSSLFTWVSPYVTTIAATMVVLGVLGFCP